MVLDVAKRVNVAGWISVAILPLCIFLLISYAVLPVKWTNRHYLSICFTLGICCMEASQFKKTLIEVGAGLTVLDRLHHPPRRQTRPMP